MPPKSKTKKAAANDTGKKACHCLICQEAITDPDGKNPGQDSIMCEGSCQGWIHRTCSGLTKESFDLLQTSPKPFKCYQCQLTAQETEISQLKAVVKAMQAELSQLKSTMVPLPAQPSYSSIATPSQSNSSLADNSQTITRVNNGPTQPPTKETRRNSRNLNFERKFNIVIYGAKECTQGTPKHERATRDLSNATQIVQKICPEVSAHSIRDCTRLGKYVPERKRPLIVTLARSCDTTSILSNRRKLADMPGISVKPIMTPQERQHEKVLLQERWKLVQNGTNKLSIKLRGDTLYVNGIKHGYATGSGFTLLKPESKSESLFPAETSYPSTENLVNDQTQHGTSDTASN